MSTRTTSFAGGRAPERWPSVPTPCAPTNIERMRVRSIQKTATCAAVISSFLCSFVVRAEPIYVPLFDLCNGGARVLLDVDVLSVDAGAVNAEVNAVFVKDADVPDAGPPPFADLGPGDEVQLEECFGQGDTARALVMFDGAGVCLHSFPVDDEGVLEDGKPDTITVEEAGEAAVADDCSAALSEAGFDASRYQESPLVSLLGCASTTSDVPTWAAIGLALSFASAAARRRRTR